MESYKETEGTATSVPNTGSRWTWWLIYL